MSVNKPAVYIMFVALGVILAWTGMIVFTFGIGFPLAFAAIFAIAGLSSRMGANPGGFTVACLATAFGEAIVLYMLPAAL